MNKFIIILFVAIFAFPLASFSGQADLDNHADQLNPNNDAYWQSRGEDGRPDDWEDRINGTDDDDNDDNDEMEIDERTGLTNNRTRNMSLGEREYFDYNNKIFNKYCVFHHDDEDSIAYCKSDCSKRGWDSYQMTNDVIQSLEESGCSLKEIKVIALEKKQAEEDRIEFEWAEKQIVDVSFKNCFNGYNLQSDGAKRCYERCVSKGVQEYLETGEIFKPKGCRHFGEDKPVITFIENKYKDEQLRRKFNLERLIDNYCSGKFSDEKGWYECKTTCRKKALDVFEKHPSLLQSIREAGCYERKK